MHWELSHRAVKHMVFVMACLILGQLGLNILGRRPLLSGITGEGLAIMLAYVVGVVVVASLPTITLASFSGIWMLNFVLLMLFGGGITLMNVILFLVFSLVLTVGSIALGTLIKKSGATQ